MLMVRKVPMINNVQIKKHESQKKMKNKITINQTILKRWKNCCKEDADNRRWCCKEDGKVEAMLVAVPKYEAAVAKQLRNLSQKMCNSSNKEMEALKDVKGFKKRLFPCKISWKKAPAPNITFFKTKCDLEGTYQKIINWTI